MNKGEYKCTICKEIYSFGVREKYCDIVCDDCYYVMFPDLKEKTECVTPTTNPG